MAGEAALTEGKAPLADRLRTRIRRDGPISLAAYMAAALGDRDFGYYMTRDPLGQRGDFTTAPEITQMFGELIGLWLTQVWRDRGAPGRARLLELGPGRGTLMRDLLRAAPADFTRAVDAHLLETSSVLRRTQRAALEGWNVTWHERLDTLPRDGAPLYVVANEFFDALPIRQFVRADDGWQERLVGLNAAGDPAWTLSAHVRITPPGVDRTLAEAATPGAVAETAPAVRRMAGTLGRLIARTNGAGLFVDYGYSAPALGETLQAMRGHAFAQPLERPGEADLTAHVDFAAVAAALRRGGAATAEPIPMGAFLTRLGIGARAMALKRRATPEQAADIAAAHARLTNPAGMGGLFRALGFAAPGTPPLPGL